jgi:ribonuclease P protein subunit RPR2
MGKNKKDGRPQKIGLERIERLFEIAEKEIGKHPHRSHNNVKLARKIAMRYNIRLPRSLKRKFCGKCYKYLSPNINCSIRKSKQGILVIKCGECGTIKRIRVEPR